MLRVVSANGAEKGGNGPDTDALNRVQRAEPKPEPDAEVAADLDRVRPGQVETNACLLSGAIDRGWTDR